MKGITKENQWKSFKFKLFSTLMGDFCLKKSFFEKVQKFYVFNTSETFKNEEIVGIGPISKKRHEALFINPPLGRVFQ